ncbi:SEFIR domain-containing protein [Nannocystaceae bacterium ST9]
MPITKRVFISYSQDSAAHAGRVLALADRLRADGVETDIDKYTASPLDGWQRWTQTQLTDSDYILVVCTPTYRRRFDGKDASGSGQASTSEGLIAQQLLYDANSLNTKLIPVIFEDAEYEDIPLTLRPFTRHRLPASYDDLVRHITGQSRTPAPSLGKLGEMPPAPRQIIDNHGASIGQQILARGTVNIGPVTIGTLHPPVLPIIERRKILLFTANATHQGGRLRLEEELRAILDGLSRAHARDYYDPKISPAVTFMKVVHELDDDAPGIVHFSGHGGADGGIILLDERGRQADVAPSMIAELFAALRHAPELAVFAACKSDRMAAAAAVRVGHAIGFVGEIEDSTARQFSAVFYERLASQPELDVPRAFKLAKLATIGSGYVDAEQARLF